MTKENQNNSFNKPEDTVDIREMVLAVWKDRLKVIYITCVFAIARGRHSAAAGPMRGDQYPAEHRPTRRASGAGAESRRHRTH